MDKIGKYIYGIIPNVANQRSISSGSRSDAEAFTTFGINSNSKESPGSYGITACREVHPVTNTIGAIQDSKICKGVHLIPYQDIAAVVKDSQIVDYTHMFKDTLAKALVEHQKVIEKIMALEYTIIPLRLGTFAEDEEEVRHILIKGHSFIKNIFDKTLNKIEIDVVATWSDFTSVVKEAGEQKEIKELKENLLANPEGITIDDQMKAGFMLKKALDERREKFALKILDALKILSPDSKIHELMDDKMVLNSAFLIDKAKEKEFYAKIEDLNNEFAQKLNFRCVGPLPAYSFYTLEVKKMQFSDVDWARKKLGILNDSSSKDEIKKAYQRQAFTFHPDKNPDRPGIEKEFDEIKKSYQILLDYAYACQQAEQKNIIFNADEFKRNALLVKLKE